MVFNLLLNLGKPDLFIVDQLAFLSNLPRSHLYPSIFFLFPLWILYISCYIPSLRHIVLFSFVLIIGNTSFPIIFLKINFTGQIAGY